MLTCMFYFQDGNNQKSRFKNIAYIIWAISAEVVKRKDINQAILFWQNDEYEYQQLIERV